VRHGNGYAWCGSPIDFFIGTFTLFDVISGRVSDPVQCFDSCPPQEVAKEMEWNHIRLE
jgi:hypothetical protein